MTVKRPGTDYAIEPDDDIIIYDSGSYDVMLPYARGFNRDVYIINFGTGTITVKCQALEKVHNDTSVVIYQNTTLHLFDAEFQKWVLL